MANDYLKDIICGNNPLGPLIYRFNYLSASYLHQTRLAKYLPAWAEGKLLASRRVVSKLSDMILREEKLEGKYFFDFEDPLRRIALLDTSVLDRLIFLVGLTVHAPRISQIIRKSEALKVKEDIGNDAYDFAVKKAAWLYRGPYFTVSVDKDLSIKESINQVGKRYFEVALSGEEETLTRRLQWKFSIEGQPEFSAEPDENKDGARALLMKIGQKEVGECALCFS